MCEEGPFLRREMHKAIGLIMGNCFSASCRPVKGDFCADFWLNSRQTLRMNITVISIKHFLHQYVLKVNNFYKYYF